jgi:glycopeptide antibiotics resistance protein
MQSRLLRLLAWALLLGIVFVTLSPIGLRPETGASPRLERFAAFFILSAAFTLAYPHRLVRVLLLVAAAAIGLELLQLIVPTRDARLSDMLVKLLGGGVGATVGVALIRLFPKRSIVPAEEV